MARRKKTLQDGYSSDSDSQQSDASNSYQNANEDERAERELFEQSGNKRRRRNPGEGKASAWEGVFGDEAEEIGRRFDRQGKRNGAFKAPTFVAKSEPAASSSKLESPPKVVSPELSDDDSEPEQEDEKGPTRTRENSYSDSEDEKVTPTIGLGAGRGSGIGIMPTRGGFGGIGSSRGRGGAAGIGSSNGSSGGSRISMSSFAKSSGTEKDQAKDLAQAKLSPSRPEPHRLASNDNLGGIGTEKRHEIEQAEEEALYPSDPAHAFPQSFGQTRPPPPQKSASTRQQVKFQAPLDSRSSSPSIKHSVTTKDLNHLQSIAGSFGARLLAKQGWTPGKGLGREEDGKAVPIEASTGLTRGQGISKGVRTEQSRREAKERGDLDPGSSEEDRKPKKKNKDKNKEAPGRGPKAEWRNSRKIKVKVEHKTYDELVAEASAGSMAPTGVGLVLDARGGDLREVFSMADLALSARAATEWTPTGDKMQLPELRHNLRLILESTKSDVQALIKEGQSVRMRREWAKRDTIRLQKERETEQSKMDRLQEIKAVVQTVATKAQAISSERDVSLQRLETEFKKLSEDYQLEYEEYDLDEVVIGAIVQVIGSTFREWQPLSEADPLLDALLPWKRAFRLSSIDLIDQELEDVDYASKRLNNVMTPYEAMLEKYWLPRVRSALNNDWSASNPNSAVRLVENWTPILPRFIRDNVLDQLVLPKVSKQVADWNPRRQKSGQEFSLASCVFPWLSVLRDRSDGLVDEAKIKIGEMMKRWSVTERIPEEWSLWRDIFSKGKWDTLLLLNVVPKLAAHMDSAFEVNPRDQDMEPLDRVLRWSGLMRESTLVQVLEEKFFPVWLETLHFWLIQPGWRADEVASWYQYWKNHFESFKTSTGEPISKSKAIDHGFNAGLNLMDEAMRLGPNASTQLIKPAFTALPEKRAAEKKAKKDNRARLVAATPTDTEITFRSIAEKYAADHNLLFIPTGSSHTGTGKQLLKVAKSLDGRGVTIYVAENAVYAQGQDGTFRAVLLEEMVKMAGV